ncbi:MAG: type II toxin-antitoxin system VapC family toxin [Pirellulales bacterium]|nr:type II toxin-antitoxin system VapC family toxin [Pirellulales bacterium]
MKLVDLNVLLYAVNRDAFHHEAVRSWWESALSGEETVGLPWIVLLGFLRLATSDRVLPRPLTPAQATERIDAWLALGHVRALVETEEHWRIFRELLSETGTAGNLTTDVHLAAMAISHGATLVSCDADFGRFAKLRWRNPVA